jgi:hypothetical protein
VKSILYSIRSHDVNTFYSVDDETYAKDGAARLKFGSAAASRPYHLERRARRTCNRCGSVYRKALGRGCAVGDRSLRRECAVSGMQRQHSQRDSAVDSPPIFTPQLPMAAIPTLRKALWLRVGSVVVQRRLDAGFDFGSGN